VKWSAGCRSIELTDDIALVAAGSFPLVVVSHGTGGSHLLYRALAAHLARNGFVVALPEHPQNNRNDNDLGGTAANLAQRPRPVEVTRTTGSPRSFCWRPRPRGTCTITRWTPSTPRSSC
jgi:predicted dienelactone hydrolase